jgi:hypothetical protein
MRAFGTVMLALRTTHNGNGDYDVVSLRVLRSGQEPSGFLLEATVEETTVIIVLLYYLQYLCHIISATYSVSCGPFL